MNKRTIQNALKLRDEPKRRSMTARSGWWEERYADLVERRRPNGTYPPREKKNHVRVTYPLPVSPTPMMSRPEGMSRQVARALYREACKAESLDYRGYGCPSIESEVSP